MTLDLPISYPEQDLTLQSLPQSPTLPLRQRLELPISSRNETRPSNLFHKAQTAHSDTHSTFQSSLGTTLHLPISTRNNTRLSNLCHNAQKHHSYRPYRPTNQHSLFLQSPIRCIIRLPIYLLLEIRLDSNLFHPQRRLPRQFSHQIDYYAYLPFHMPQISNLTFHISHFTFHIPHSTFSHRTFRTSHLEPRNLETSNLESRISNIESHISHFIFHIASLTYRISRFAFRIPHFKIPPFRISHLESRISNLESHIPQFTFHTPHSKSHILHRTFRTSHLESRISNLTHSTCLKSRISHHFIFHIASSYISKLTFRISHFAFRISHFAFRIMHYAFHISNPTFRTSHLACISHLDKS